MPFIADFSRAALRGVLYVALSAVAFGAMAIFGRYAYAGGADVLGLLIVRFSIAGALLVAVARRRRVRWPRGRALAAIVGMGALGYVGQSLCYFSALQHAQASLVALLLYLYPAFVALLAAWWLGERLTRAKAVALALCVAGSALMVGGGRGEPLGIALALGAAVVYSLYIVVGAKAARGVDPLATVAVICCAAPRCSPCSRSRGQRRSTRRRIGRARRPAGRRSSRSRSCRPSPRCSRSSPVSRGLARPARRCSRRSSPS